MPKSCPVYVHCPLACRQLFAILDDKGANVNPATNRFSAGPYQCDVACGNSVSG